MSLELSYIHKVYLRLILGWVIWESVILNILSSFHHPFNGVVKTSISVLFISLIGYFIPKKGSILLSALVVVAFKYILNPAIAVNPIVAILLQATFGQLLFSNIKYYRLSCILLATFAFTAGAIQFALFQLVRHGVEFEQATVETVYRYTGYRANTAYAILYIFAYFVIHILFGLLAGHYIANLIRFVRRVQKGKIELPGVNPRFEYHKSNYFSITNKRLSPVILMAALLLLLYLKLRGPIAVPAGYLLLLRILFWFFLWQTLMVPAMQKAAIAYAKKYKQEPYYLKLFIQILPDVVSVLAESARAAKGVRRTKKPGTLLKVAAFHMLNTKECAPSLPAYAK